MLAWISNLIRLSIYRFVHRYRQVVKRWVIAKGIGSTLWLLGLESKWMFYCSCIHISIIKFQIFQIKIIYIKKYYYIIYQKAPSSFNLFLYPLILEFITFIYFSTSSISASTAGVIFLEFYNFYNACVTLLKKLPKFFLNYLFITNFQYIWFFLDCPLVQRILKALVLQLV